MAARLTSNQLFDLYRRLDTNGDGSLDIQEFYLIAQRLNFVDNSTDIINAHSDKKDEGSSSGNVLQDQLLNAFTIADKDGSQGLSIDEFRIAYDILYYDSIATSGKHDLASTVLTATRYGFDKKERKYIFQCYTGTLFAIREFVDYLNEDIHTNKPHIESCRGGLDEIFHMILEDGKFNYENGSNIMWWVDVAADKLEPPSIAMLISRLGLPNDIEANLNASKLEETRDSRLLLGRGISTSGFNVESLSIYTQAMCMSNMPVDVEREFLGEFGENNIILNMISKYLGARIGTPWIDKSDIHDIERLKALKRAKDRADFIISRDDPQDLEYLKSKALLPSEIETLSSSIRNVESTTTSYFTGAHESGSSKLGDKELEEDSSMLFEISNHESIASNIHKNERNVLLSRDTMKKRIPKIREDLFSIHIMDQGFGAKSLLTIRKIDEEGDQMNINKGTKGLSSSQRSKIGTLGRILTGIWGKLHIVMKKDGVTPTDSQLADSTSALCHTILGEIHDLSIDTVESLREWNKIVCANLDHTPTPDHFRHIQSLISCSNDVARYFGTTHAILELMTTSDEEVNERISKKKLAKLREPIDLLPMPAPPSTLPSVVPEDDPEVDTALKLGIDLDLNLMTPTSMMNDHNIYAKPRIKTSNRNNINLGIDENVEPPDSTQFVLCWEIMKPFIGPDIDNVVSLIDGDKQRGLRGTETWQREYKQLSNALKDLQVLYHSRLGEARNYWVLLLAFVIMASWPFLLLTTYWSMNFENMVEYDTNYYSGAEGINLAWVVFSVIYSTMIIAAFHNNWYVLLT